MMGKMVKNMIYFVVLLLVVLMSFGVCRQSILFPNSEPSWRLVREVFFQPYFMLYGEVFAQEIDPPCGEAEGMGKCQPGRWITPTVMSIYLLVANILLINLLIAVFNNIFNEVNAVSHQVWMFQRFTVVMEYEQKPVLPPPLIILDHIYLLVKFCRRKVNGEREIFDNALKLFLDSDDLERLYDFEEECVEGYFREQEMKLQMSSDERIKSTSERVENMVQKVEDINIKENSQSSSIQSVEFRLRNLEELSQQTVQHLAVIHRFMATHVKDPLSADILDVRMAAERMRRSSERSEDTKVASEVSDTCEKLLLPPGFNKDNLARRRPTRSLTEVRPDPFIFGETFHLRMDESSKSPEVARSKASNLLEEEEEEERESVDETKNPLSRRGSKKISAQVSRQKSFSKNSIGEHEGSLQDSKGKSAEQEEDDEIPDVDELMDRFQNDSVEFRSHRRESEIYRKPSFDLGDGDDSERESISHRAPMLSTRQLSKTHSEPENATCNNSMDGSDFPRAAMVERSVTWAEPRITVIPPTAKPRSSRLMTMHTEYTSITDELETVCGLLSPPCTPHLLSPPRPGEASTQRMRHTSEMSNPEMALYIEKEHLRDAEESDYQMMERLILRRETREEEPPDNSCFLTVANEVREYRTPQPYRSLRRSSAIEVKDFPTPSVSQLPPIPGDDSAVDEDQPMEELRPSESDSTACLVPTSETMC